MPNNQVSQMPQSMGASGSPQATSLMNTILPNQQSQQSNQPNSLQAMLQSMVAAQQAQQNAQGVGGGHAGGVQTQGTPQGGGMQLASMIAGMFGA